MARQVTLRDANQNFARYVRDVANGEEIVITRRGEPVARLVPAKSAVRKLTPEQEEALARTRRLAEMGYTMGGERFDRDEAHER